jgi:hypothetical protein
VGCAKCLGCAAVSPVAGSCSMKVRVRSVMTLSKGGGCPKALSTYVTRAKCILQHGPRLDQQTSRYKHHVATSMTLRRDALSMYYMDGSDAIIA